MLANRVKETTTTTGTGNLTLAGAVTNFQTFNTAFGTDYRFRYYIEDATNNIWEEGVGYLSASTTLVREAIRSNSSGTTSALNLSAGTKNVYVGLSDDNIQPLPVYFVNADVKPLNQGPVTTTFALVASREYYALCQVPVGTVSSISVYISTAAAAGKIARIALYAIGTDGFPASKVAETSTFAVDSTGLKNVAITVPEGINGWVWAFIIADGTPSVYVSNNSGRTFDSSLDTLDSENGYAFKGGSGTTAPDPASTSLSNGGGQHIAFAFRR